MTRLLSVALTGLDLFYDCIPRALPWATILRPFRALVCDGAIWSVVGLDRRASRDASYQSKVGEPAGNAPASARADLVFETSAASLYRPGLQERQRMRDE